MTVAIIDYGSGNLHSAAKAFERASRSMQDPQNILVTRDPEAVYRADRIVLPGVGAFADCRRGLDAVDGMLEALTEAVRNKARPFFGICVGMQLMATRGKEHVTTDGFNWIEGDVEKITPREENLKIPHMGWNTLDPVRDHPVLERLPLGPKGRHAYFVHSYHLKAVNEADVLARADYCGPVTAITLARATSRTWMKSRSWPPSSNTLAGSPAATEVAKIAATPAYGVSGGIRGP